jgi:hypothetical protein
LAWAGLSWARWLTGGRNAWIGGLAAGHLGRRKRGRKNSTGEERQRGESDKSWAKHRAIDNVRWAARKGLIADNPLPGV